MGDVVRAVRRGDGVALAVARRAPPDGVDVSFELLSVDSPDAETELKKWLARELPGPISWVKSPDDFSGWLEKSLGIDPDSAIPIHVLVDRAGRMRCARVGAVHAHDYGAVRALLTGR